MGQDAWETIVEAIFAGDRKLRERIASGIQEVEARLANDPMECSESRDGNRRIAFLGCFGLYFHLDGEARKVLVTHVWIPTPPRR